jgi:hypothetical protein
MCHELFSRNLERTDDLFKEISITEFMEIRMVNVRMAMHYKGGLKGKVMAYLIIKHICEVHNMHSR